MSQTIVVTARSPRRVGTIGLPGVSPAPAAGPLPVTRRGVRRRGADMPWTAVEAPGERPGVVWWRLALGGVATFIVVVVAGLAVFASLPAVAGYRPVVIETGSMQPTILEGDVVLLDDVDPRSLKTGTVVNFTSSRGSVLHRIDGREGDRYRTKGDANRTADGELVSPEQIRGVGIVVVPFIGRVSLWMDRGRWAELGLFIVGMLVAVYMSGGHWIDPGARRRIDE